MISLGSIKGAVSIAIEGHEPSVVASFSVPVTVMQDPDGGAVLNAAPHDAIVAAAAAALQDAATQLLASIPTAEVTEVPDDGNDRA